MPESDREREQRESKERAKRQQRESKETAKREIQRENKKKEKRGERRKAVDANTGMAGMSERRDKNSSSSEPAHKPVISRTWEWLSPREDLYEGHTYNKTVRARE